jgi:hypothetical protein
MDAIDASALAPPAIDASTTEVIAKGPSPSVCLLLTHDPGELDAGPPVTGNVRLSVSAGSPVDSAERVLRSVFAAAARSCYNHALRRDPSLAGRLVLAITVSPGGEVEATSVRSNQSLSPQLAGCIVGASRRLRFAREDASASDTVLVTLTFTRNP